LANIAASQTTVNSSGSLELDTLGTVDNEQLALNGVGVVNAAVSGVWNNQFQGAVGTGALRNVSGSNTWNGTIAGMGNVSVASTSSIGADASTTLTIGSATGVNIVTGTSLLKLGLGVVELGGTVSNTHSGNTLIAEGTLRLNKQGAATAIPGGEVIIGDNAGPDNGDVLLHASTAGGNQIGDRITRIASTGLWDLNGQTETVNNAIVLDAGRTISGNIATGAGALVNNNALIAVSHGGAGASSPPAVVTGRYDLNGGNRNIDVREGGAPVELDMQAVVQVAGAFGVTKIGQGRLRLSNANTYTGNTSVNTGVLEVGHNSALGGGTGTTTVASGAAVEFKSASPLVVNETFTVSGDGWNTSGDGVLNSISDADVTLTGLITVPDASYRATSTIGNHSTSGDLTLQGNTLLTASPVANLVFSGDGDINVPASIVAGLISAPYFSSFEGRLFLPLQAVNSTNINNLIAGGATAPTATAPLVGALNFPQDSDARFTTFFGGGVPGGAAFSVVFEGMLVIPTTGTYYFAATNNDDNSTVWIDTSGNNAFEAGEMVQSVGCCNATGFVSRTLNAGTYRIVYANSDSGGGSGLTGRFQPGTLGVPANGLAMPIVSTVSSGNVIKNDAGTLTVSGANSYIDTTINGGIVLANGAQSALGLGTTTVNATATLGGSGVITGPVLVNTGGAIAPGSPLSATADIASQALTLSAGSSLTATINGVTVDTQYDQWDVTGAVSLGGASLVLAGSHIPNGATQQSIVLIDNDGSDPVVGQFAGLPEGAVIAFNGGQFFITYQGGTGNDVVLNSQPVVNGTNAGDTLVLTPTALGFDYQLNANPVVSVTSGATQFTFNGQGEDDRMTVQLNSNALPSGGVFYNGGAQASPLTAGVDPQDGDVLSISGDGTQTAIYLGDATANALLDNDGSVSIVGQGVVNFTQLEPVDISGMLIAQVHVTGGDDVITIDQGFDAATNLVPALVVSGTSGGVAFEAVHLFNNSTVLVDTASGGTDGNDTITIAGGSNAHGNDNLILSSGATGLDSLTIDGDITVNGNITLQVNGPISQNAGDDIVASALELMGVGTTSLSNAGNSVDVLAANRDGAITYRNSGALGIGAILGLGTTGITTINDDVQITVLAGGLLIDGGISLGAGDLSLNVVGAITQNPGADITAGGLELLGTGVTTLTNAGNDVATLAANRDGVIEWTDAGMLTVGTVTGLGTAGITTVNDDVRLTVAGGGLVIDADVALGTGDLTLDVTGAISQNVGDNVVANGVELLGVGATTLTDATNNVATLAANRDGVIEYSDAGTLTIGSVSGVGTSGLTTVGDDVRLVVGAGGLVFDEDVTLGAGRLSLQVTGNVSQNAGDTVSAAALAANASGGVTLGEANDVDTLAVQAGGAVVFHDVDALTVGSLTLFSTTVSGLSAGGNVSVRVDDNAGSTDDLVVTHGIVTTAGSITLRVGDDVTATAPLTATTTLLIEVDGAAGVDADVNVTTGGSTVSLLGVTAPAGATIQGGADNDTFQITPSATASFAVHGGSPTFGDPGVPPGDTLDLNLSGVAPGNTTLTLGSPLGSGIYSFVAPETELPVSFTSIEQNPASAGAYHLVLDMRLSGFQNGVADQILADFVGASPDLRLRVNSGTVFTGPAADVLSLTVIGSTDDDSLVIDETAQGVVDFAGAAPAVNNAPAGGVSNGGHLNATADAYLDAATGGVTPADVSIHFDGGAGVNSLALNYVTAHAIHSSSDTLDGANSGNIGVLNAAGTTLQSLLSYARVTPVTVTGAGGSLVVDASSTPAVTQLDVSNSGGLGDGVNQIASPAGQGLAAHTFSGFGTVAARSGTGSETINLFSLDAATPASPAGAAPVTSLLLDANNATNTDAAGQDTLIVWTAPASVAVSLKGGAADDLFVVKNGVVLGGTVDGGTHGPQGDTLDFSDFSSSATVDLLTGSASFILGGAAGGIFAGSGGDAGSSIENLLAGSGHDNLTADADVNRIRGNAGDDDIDAGAGIDNVDGGAGNDDLLVRGTEAEFDVMQGGPGGVEDPTDFDRLLNVGAGPVTLNGFNSLFDVFANSIDLYNGNGFALLGNTAANQLHLGFTEVQNTPVVASGDLNDDVTTSFDNDVATEAAPGYVTYDGGNGVDRVTLVLTPDQFGALTTAELLVVQDYVVAPSGKTLTVTEDNAKGNFRATNFESARVAVYDDDIVLDITSCFLAIVTEDQVVVGGAGNDTLNGTHLTDLIFGGDGDDEIHGLDGSDCIFGGAGRDSLFGENLNDLLVGGSGDDTIRGGADEDRIFGGSGADSLFGEFGHDWLEGGSGNDLVDGGDNNDTVNGGAGVDTVLGGEGADRIRIRADEAITDTMNGGGSWDVLELIAGSGPVTLAGFSSATSNIELIEGNGQVLQGTDSADTFNLSTIGTPTGLASIDGLGGDDTLIGSATSDVLRGGEGNDLLVGGVGFDNLQGGEGNDTLDGGLHDDILTGGPGVDSLSGGDGYDQFRVQGNDDEFDTMQGGLNTDTVVNYGSVPVVLNTFNSLTNGMEGWAGGGQPIVGNDAANVLNFQLISMSGVPFIDGGLGNDTITGTNGVDELRGGIGNDTLFGMGGTDILRGGANDDSLNGGDGVDSLYGDDGVDTITTGAGRDIIYFAGDLASEDVITDFALYSDTINLQAYAPLTYSNTWFTITSPTTRITLPNGKRIRLLNWARVVASSQFKL
jgi:fibronectin-binding autotransporter adhesin